jgi:hydroxyethylthiazole kinase
VDTTKATLKSIAQLLQDLKAQKPLVHHLTNYVTANDCANIVLALGGSPVMADDAGEVSEMAGLASALVINIGTLNERTITSMFTAGKRANELGVPIVLDPVGSGATSLRTKTAERYLKEIKLAVLRGNMSEIKTLAGSVGATRGVDSTEDSSGGKELAVSLARKYKCVVAITGAQDVITDGTRVGLIDNGHPTLAHVTGTGCMATSLVGCFCGVTKDYYLAACAGVMTMGLAGEKAFKANGSGGIGSFRVSLMDVIYQMGPDDYLLGGKLTELAGETRT